MWACGRQGPPTVMGPLATGGSYMGPQVFMNSGVLLPVWGVSCGQRFLIFSVCIYSGLHILFSLEPCVRSYAIVQFTSRITIPGSASCSVMVLSVNQVRTGA